MTPSQWLVRVHFKLVWRRGEARTSKSPGQVTVSVLDDAAMTRRWQELEGPKPSDFLVSPHIQVRNRQQTVMTISNEVTFLRDGALVVTQSGQTIADPVIGTLEEGIKIECCPIIRQDVRSVDLELRFETSKLKRPVSTHTTKLKGWDDEVTLDLPEVIKTEWSSDEIALGPEDAGFVVRGLEVPREGPSESTGRRPLEILCRIAIEIPKDEEPLGEVLYRDAASGKLGVRWPGFDRDTVPDLISILRDGKTVGTARCLERAGDIFILELTGGEAKVGDRVK
ncbi:MAG: hypothetical protein AB1486_01985 [Planctomycetota bacterium]